MNSLRIVFAGSPAVAMPSLHAIARSPHEVVGVVTRHDSPLGRKRVITSTPVATAAEQLGLEVIRANRLDDEATSAITRLQPDLGVIVAYGGLVREPLLTAPRLGWINLHFSLLPKWRGAAPVQRSIMAGDTVTGAAIFQLAAELDAGDLFATLTRRIGAHETAGKVLDDLAVSGAELLVSTIDELADGTARAVAQLGQPSFAPKLTLDDARIDWNRPARDLHNQVRGVTPEPGAFTTVSGVRLKVLQAAVAHDAAPVPAGSLRFSEGRVLVGTATIPLELIEVQPAGKRAMRAADWWNGLGVDQVAVE